MESGVGMPEAKFREMGLVLLMVYVLFNVGQEKSVSIDEWKVFWMGLESMDRYTIGSGFLFLLILVVGFVGSCNSTPSPKRRRIMTSNTTFLALLSALLLAESKPKSIKAIYLPILCRPTTRRYNVLKEAICT